MCEEIRNSVSRETFALERKETDMTDFKYWKKNTQKIDEEPIGESIVHIPADSIRPNRAQPRANFDNNSMIRLADSIRRYGILQPLSVRKTDDDDDTYDYELVAGERRLRAAKMLGLFTVPCVVLTVDEKTSAELAIIENLLREDLDMFEQALGFRRLIDDYGMTQEELARRMSMSQSAVANKLRLLRLTYGEQQKILEFSLSERHARALLRLGEESDRLAAIAKIHEEHLTVQKTELLIEKILAAKISASVAADVSAAEGIGSAKGQEEEFEADAFERAIRREKEVSECLKGLKRKVDSLSKNGGNAKMDIESGGDSIVVTIYIKK